MNNTKTILLIGRTGNGKSTLANVLLGRKDKDGKEVFGESASSVSKTKKVQIEEFEYEFRVEQEEWEKTKWEEKNLVSQLSKHESTVTNLYQKLEYLKSELFKKEQNYQELLSDKLNAKQTKSSDSKQQLTIFRDIQSQPEQLEKKSKEEHAVSMETGDSDDGLTETERINEFQSPKELKTQQQKESEIDDLTSQITLVTELQNSKDDPVNTHQQLDQSNQPHAQKELEPVTQENLNKVQAEILEQKDGDLKKRQDLIQQITDQLTKLKWEKNDLQTKLGQVREKMKELERTEKVIYRIVDTVGIGDTRMSEEKKLRKLALMGHSVKDGLSQILLVTDGRLAEEAKSTYDLLKKVVLDKYIADYTTIVRTNFADFRDKESCEEEEEKMLKRSGEFKKLVEECRERIIFVDNPPVNIAYKELGDLNMKKREESRMMLLNHLKKVCQKNYEPGNLKELGEVIGNYEIEKEKLKEKKKNGWLLGNLKNNVKNKILNEEITKRMIDRIKSIEKLERESSDLLGKDSEKDLEAKENERKINYFKDKISRLEIKILEKNKEERIVQEKLGGKRLRDEWETEEVLNKRIDKIQAERKKNEEELEKTNAKLQSLQKPEELMQVQIESSSNK